jgi:hypothetical protein
MNTDNHQSIWQYILIPANILFSPLIFWFWGQYFVPQSVLALDGGYFSDVLIALMSSFIVSILIFLFLLVLGKGKISIKRILIITLVPLPVSALVAPITIGLAMLMALYLNCIFNHAYCGW